MKSSLALSLLFFGFLGSGCFGTVLVNTATVRSTLDANNACLKDQIEDRGYNHYKLDPSYCYHSNASFLTVEVRIPDTNSTVPSWALLVNTQGNVPVFDDDNFTISNGTVAVSSDSIDGKSYALLNVMLAVSEDSAPDIYASVYSTGGPLVFLLKAWCSDTYGCQPSCSDPDTGPCVSSYTCRCIRDIAYGSCDIHEEVLSITDNPGQGHALYFVHDQISLGYGEWKYFKFKVDEPDSRILVEMSRSFGDPVLYLKPKGDGDLPIEIDFYKYADVTSFQNRLSHHHIYGTGWGYYFIGVYNNDACMEEDTYFNLSISIAPSSLKTVALCPLNCSYPNGKCTEDGNCSCESGFGGTYCEGSLSPAKPRNSFSGLLHPGDWAYFSVRNSDVPNMKNVSVKFVHTGGHGILLAKQNGYPTLTDNHLKFTDTSLNATASDTYDVDTDSLADGELILALFNVDYPVQGDLQFELLIIGGRVNGLKIWVILLVAICSSLVVLAILLVSRRYMTCGGERTGDHPLDFEATQGSEVVLDRIGMDRGIVSTYPLLSYREGLLQDTRCPICLVDYSVPQLLRRIPVCRHVFHVNCIDEWFLSHSSCPICRISLQTHTTSNQENREGQG